jgi:hypothetical protein
MDISRMLAELQSERQRIDQAISALQSIAGTSSSSTGARRGRRPGRPPKSASAAPQSTGGRRGRRTMSAAARKRISEMMKQRWAERKKRTGK